MAEHLSDQQLKGYRDRTLTLGELVAVDTHLGACQPCRTALSRLAEGKSSKAVISGIDQARFRHLSYEQMDDWVEDRLEPADRELVMAHIGLCPPCARQLIAYQEYAPVMSAPVRTAAFAAAQAVEKKESFWSFLKQPHYALGAAALVAFFIIVPFTRHSGPEETGATILAPTSTTIDSTIPAQNSPLLDQALHASELDSLPDSLRVGAKEAIADTGGMIRPASLKGLEGGSDPVLEYPLAEVVAETQPVLRWKTFGNSTYSVSLSDSRGLISQRGGLTETRWMPPSALLRDHVYTWVVDSAGVKHRAMFRVLGASQQRELEKVRAERGTSHLVMGAVSAGLGLLTPAKQEFEAMGRDKAQSQQAAKLLNRIETLRK
jgi:hypothetical protein